MGKIYFGFRMIFLRISSFFTINFLRCWGLRCGKKTIINKKPIISGYLNKISLGEKCSLHEGIRIVVNKEGSLRIGDNTLISANVNINSGVGNISIGNNVMIAANTYIINNDHNVFQELSVRNSGHITEDIIIEDNVWIGANCTILKGVTVGEGAIIGAGSVVTKNVKPYSINLGVPCKFSKFRFEMSELEKKLQGAGYSQEKIELIIKDKMELK